MRAARSAGELLYNRVNAAHGTLEGRKRQELRAQGCKLRSACYSCRRKNCDCLCCRYPFAATAAGAAVRLLLPLLLLHCPPAAALPPAAAVGVQPLPQLLPLPPRCCRFAAPPLLAGAGAAGAAVLLLLVPLCSCCCCP